MIEFLLRENRERLLDRGCGVIDPILGKQSTSEKTRVKLRPARCLSAACWASPLRINSTPF